MSKEQHILWKVPSRDLSVSPLGYSVEIGEDALVCPVSSRHSTFENTGEFEVSLSGGAFLPYPKDGISGATSKTTVRMLRNGETPTSVMVIGNDSFLYKMSLDCSRIMLHKQICETNSYSIDSVTCDASGKIWVKDTGGVMTVLDRQFNTLNTFRLSAESIFSAIDPFRRLLWQVSRHNITLTRTQDMSVVLNVALPTMASAVTDWDLSSPSGTLFLVLDASRAVSVTMQGVLTTFSLGATGVCQWGAAGALACIPGAGVVESFDGSSVTGSFSGSAIGTPNPSRIASTGRGCSFVVDSSGLTVKVDESWTSKWSLEAPPFWSNLDVRTTNGPRELGRVLYLLSTSGVAAYRDMLTSGKRYGMTAVPLLAGNGSALYPAAAVIPELSCAHASMRITAISSDDVTPYESPS